MLVKTVKISEKGQIAIPKDVREQIGISRGDELILVQDGNKLLLERVSKRLIDDFKDIVKHSEDSLKKIWSNKKDDVWNKYKK